MSNIQPHDSKLSVAKELTVVVLINISMEQMLIHLMKRQLVHMGMVICEEFKKCITQFF